MYLNSLMFFPRFRWHQVRDGGKRSDAVIIIAEFLFFFVGSGCRAINLEIQCTFEKHMFHMLKRQSVCLVQHHRYDRRFECAIIFIIWKFNCYDVILLTPIWYTAYYIRSFHFKKSVRFFFSFVGIPCEYSKYSFRMIMHEIDHWIPFQCY